MKRKAVALNRPYRAGATKRSVVGVARFQVSSNKGREGGKFWRDGSYVPICAICG
jgi:hypothetical protein